MLTAKQQQCYRYLKEYAAMHHGMSPTFQEIADALGLRSKSRVTRILDSMEARGRVRRIRDHHRAIEVIPECSPRNARVIQGTPLSYPSPEAQFFVWDAEAKALKPMEGKR